MHLPPSLHQRLSHLPHTVDTVGMSSAHILFYESMVLKISPATQEAAREAQMLAWLRGKLPVPELLHCETENGAQYLLMARAPGQMACSPPIMDDPARLVRLMAEALHMLWAVDTTGCPAHNGLADKLEAASAAVLRGHCGTEDAEPGTYGPGGFQNPAHLLEWLKANRPEENHAFTHGDLCLPNIFIHRGKVASFIDLGRSGIADPYQDIALCYRSLQHNYDGTYGGTPTPGFTPEALFTELGVSPDREKLRYYILLDELF